MGTDSGPQGPKKWAKTRPDIPSISQISGRAGHPAGFEKHLVGQDPPEVNVFDDIDQLKESLVALHEQAHGTSQPLRLCSEPACRNIPERYKTDAPVVPSPSLRGIDR